jgi:NAD(P)H dehydrogenase (quinone)
LLVIGAAGSKPGIISPQRTRIPDLANYDEIVVGTGTRFGRVSSQMAAFLDQAGSLWMRGALHGKVGGAFSASGTQHGGQEMTLFSIIANLLHFGMVIVGLDYGHAGQMTLEEITGGSPYGATTISGADGSRRRNDRRGGSRRRWNDSFGAAMRSEQAVQLSNTG